MNWTQDELEKKLAENPALTIKTWTGHGPQPGNPQLYPKIELQSTRKGIEAQAGNKYHVAPKEARIYNGILFASKKEAEFAAQLDLRVRAGEIDFWLRQVPFILPGGTVYRLDFETYKGVFASPGERAPYWEIHYFEVKGHKIPLGELKRKQCEEIFHIKIDVV